MILKCKKAGKDVSDVSGMPALCRSCSGEIEVSGNRVTLKTTADGFRPLPRAGSHGFDCPATITNPQSSELVQVV